MSGDISIAGPYDLERDIGIYGVILHLIPGDSHDTELVLAFVRLDCLLPVSQVGCDHVACYDRTVFDFFPHDILRILIPEKGSQLRSHQDGLRRSEKCFSHFLSDIGSCKIKEMPTDRIERHIGLGFPIHELPPDTRPNLDFLDAVDASHLVDSRLVQQGEILQTLIADIDDIARIVLGHLADDHTLHSETDRYQKRDNTDTDSHSSHGQYGSHPVREHIPPSDEEDGREQHMGKTDIERSMR